MALTPDAGFVVQPLRGSSESLLRFGFTFRAVLLLLVTSSVQAQSAPASNPIRKDKPGLSAERTVLPQEGAPPPVGPLAPSATVERKPPQPAAVAWEDKQLTIDADNSTLGNILVAVRERTGASIEVPPAAWEERVVVHLGPGPARDVISSLLYGSPFDYIIEASEDDPDTLRSVMLTAQGKADTSGDVAVAGVADTEEGSGGGSSTAGADRTNRGATTIGPAHPERVRMMAGWASPSKPKFQADAEAAMAAETAAAEESAAAAQDSAAAAQGSDATAQDSAAPGQDSAATGQGSATAADVAKAAKESNPSASTADPNDQSPVGQAIQNMTRMFEQRRQIQAQQNQPPPPSSN